MGKWRDTQTEVTLEDRHAQGTWYLRDESLEISRRACNKANEEIYPSPLLVNIKLMQPYREKTTITYYTIFLG